MTDGVFFFTHGTQTAIYGQERGRFVQLLHLIDADRLSGLCVGGLVCFSAKEIGPDAIKSDCLVFDGYDDEYKFYTWKEYEKEFVECGLEFFKKIANGSNFIEAHNATKRKRREVIRKWQRNPPDYRVPIVIEAMRHNNAHHVLLGDGRIRLK